MFTRLSDYIPQQASDIESYYILTSNILERYYPIVPSHIPI